MKSTLIFRLSTFFFLAILGYSVSVAQNHDADSIEYNVKISSIYGSGDFSPFWLQNNTSGAISERPLSGNTQISVFKNIKHNTFDYSFKVTGLLRADKNSTDIYIHEIYAGMKWHSVVVSAGSKEEIYGNQDPDLSSGGLLFSGNSQPMPRIYAGIPDYVFVPLTHQLIEIKGGMSHGWFLDNTYNSNVLLHHKYAFFRVGGLSFPIQLEYGLHHVAQWGGTSPEYASNKPSLADFLKVFTASGGGATVNEQINVLGNHILSQNVGINIHINNFKINTYWQNISEDSPFRLIGYTMNKADGLWGISIRNNKFPVIQALVYEYLNTTDQSGPYHDRDGIVFGGADSYYNNYFYRSGWTYYLRTIGNPLLTSPIYNKDGGISITNNRVQAHHGGIEGNIQGYNYLIKATYSKNYGLTNGTLNTPAPKDNLSLLISVKKQIKWQNIEIGFSLASDRGAMYGNNTAAMLTLSKKGLLFGLSNHR